MGLKPGWAWADFPFLASVPAGCPGRAGVGKGARNHSKRWGHGALGSSMWLVVWEGEVTWPGDDQVEEVGTAPGVWLVCCMARGVAQTPGAQKERGFRRRW